MKPAERLGVVLFTSNLLGVEVAAAVAALEEVRSLHVITTALPRPGTVLARLRKTYRYFGPAGLVASLRARLPRPLAAGPAPRLADEIGRRVPSATHLHYPDLHSPECLEHIRSLRPDLGIVFACYRLRPSLFTIPRLGTLNLHLGKAPEFRGSSPGFYELLAGEPEVGVTIHRVDEALDSGPILLQRTFPLDPAPAGDPVEYLGALQRVVLVPAGAALMADAVRLEARGEAVEVLQGPMGTRPRRRATWTQQRELRRVVAARLRAGVEHEGRSPDTWGWRRVSSRSSCNSCLACHSRTSPGSKVHNVPAVAPPPGGVYRLR